MTWLVERLAELRRHLDHLEPIERFLKIVRTLETNSPPGA